MFLFLGYFAICIVQLSMVLKYDHIDGSKTFWDVGMCDVLISHHLLSLPLSCVNGIDKMYTDQRKSDGKRNYFLQSRNYRS